MLSGALFTVRRMVKRPWPKLPAFLMNSFPCLKPVLPVNADCWIAEVAMRALRDFLHFDVVLFDANVVVKNEDMLQRFNRSVGSGHCGNN